MAANPVSPGLAARIVKMRRERHTLEQIAAATGRHHKTVKAVLAAHGMTWRLPRPPSAASPAQEQAIVRLYEQEGLSLRQVARQSGLSDNTVLSILRRAEVTMRPSGWPTKKQA